jgi:hypothetical protein
LRVLLEDAHTFDALRKARDVDVPAAQVRQRPWRDLRVTEAFESAYTGAYMDRGDKWARSD